MPSGQTYEQIAKESLKKHLGISCELIMIGKARVRDNFENEISATYIGYSDDPMNLNKDEIENGEFLTVEQIKRLLKQENVTPHLAHSLDIYLKSDSKKLI